MWEKIPFCFQSYTHRYFGSRRKHDSRSSNCLHISGQQAPYMGEKNRYGPTDWVLDQTLDDNRPSGPSRLVSTWTSSSRQAASTEAPGGSSEAGASANCAQVAPLT